MLKKIKLILIILLSLIAIFIIFVRLRYGGGGMFPDRSGSPLLSIKSLETVADMEYPPGNIAVSESGRIFITLHPEAGPPFNVAELIEGKPVPYPDESYQPGGSAPLAFQEVLSLRIDRQKRLWALDNARHGTGKVRINAFSLDSGKLIHSYDFPDDIFNIGSHANDFQVDSTGRYIYISNASILALSPSIVVYDTLERESRNLLVKDKSVMADDFIPVVAGRRMSVFGIFAIKPGVDGIALDKNNEWLYYSSITAESMYRIKTLYLLNKKFTGKELESRVEIYAKKTMTDGMTMDLAGNLYMSDIEHSAVVIIRPDRKLDTLLRDSKLRWPDGFSFGPGGWLYVTCSSLENVLGMSSSHIRENGPYQVYRFKPGFQGIPGH